jgi:hypothetical protein
VARSNVRFGSEADIRAGDFSLGSVRYRPEADIVTPAEPERRLAPPQLDHSSNGGFRPEAISVVANALRLG